MATIHIKGEINAQSLLAFRQALVGARGQDLELHIDSGGGSLLAGLEMYQRVKGWPGQTTAIVTHAGSAATLPMVGCKRVIMEPGASIVTHRPTTAAIRDVELVSDDLRRAANDLEACETLICGCYAERTGMPVAHWLGLLSRETRWSAAGAVNLGLADEVRGGRFAMAASTSSPLTLENYPTPAAGQWRRMQDEALERERARQRGRVFIRTGAASGTGRLV